MRFDPAKGILKLTGFKIAVGNLYFFVVVVAKIDIAVH